MAVFCRYNEGMLRTKVKDNGYLHGQTSVLLFSWNGTMLRTDVMGYSYIT